MINQKASFKWDSDYLYFSVREPWPSKTSAAKFLQFTSGVEATISVAERKGHLVTWDLKDGRTTRCSTTPFSPPLRVG